MNQGKLLIFPRQNGGCLTRAIEKIFEKTKLIESKSLRDLIVTIRELTKIYAGKGNKEYGLSGQMVDFHETLENKVYFRRHAQYGDSFSYWLETQVINTLASQPLIIY